MNFNYTEEQLALQDTLRRFISKDYGFEHRRALSKAEPGFSRDAWAQYADFGLLALPFTEDQGGLGGTPIDTMLVMEMFGRGLLLEPYLQTVVVAGSLVRDYGTAAQQAELIPAIAGGELMVCLAHYEPEGRYDLHHVGTTAVRNAGGWKISGHKCVVIGAPSADKFIVSARTSDGARDESGISLFLVDRGAPGLTLRSYPTQDGGRAAEVHLDHVQVGDDDLVGELNKGYVMVGRAVDFGIAGLCAEAVGVMSALIEVTLEYLKTRKQFGAPLAKFQALQHRMADMAIATEQSRSMAILAAVGAKTDDAETRNRDITAAKAYIGQQARLVGQQAIQLHGGMGVTDELNVSHYFKRLTMICATFGDTDHHLGRFSATLMAA